MRLLLFLLSFPLLAATVSIDAGAPSDQFFTGGAAFTITYPGVTGDTTVRYGAFQYHIPTGPGAQLVTLNFRETGTVTAKFQRVFSVKLNGLLVIDRLDLFAAAGLELKTLGFVTVASAGFVDIDFSYSVKSALISSIEVKPLTDEFPISPAGGMSRQVAEPADVGTDCQAGDWAAPAVASPVLGPTFYLCIAGKLRRFRGDQEPWGAPQVADLGGVLQMETQDPDKATFPPVFYFRTFPGQMIGPFTFAGPGPIPIGLKFPVLIQPFPRAAAQ